jgi:hypothetical protein
LRPARPVVSPCGSPVSSPRGTLVAHRAFHQPALTSARPSVRARSS